MHLRLQAAHYVATVADHHLRASASILVLHPQTPLNEIAAFRTSWCWRCSVAKGWWQRLSVPCINVCNSCSVQFSWCPEISVCVRRQGSARVRTLPVAVVNCCEHDMTRTLVICRCFGGRLFQGPLLMLLIALRSRT